MPRLSPLPYRRVVRKLRAAGFVQGRQHGSHVKFAMEAADGRTRTVIVPRQREVPVGTLRSILRQAGLTPEEFDRL